MSHDDARSRARHWSLPLFRAVVAAIAAIAITFSPNHSPAYGLVVFGVFAAVTGALLIVSALRRRQTETLPTLMVSQGAVSAAIGVAALLALTLTGQLASLLVLVVIWCLATGVLELVIGRRKVDGAALRRDHLAVGGFSVLLGVAYLLGRDDAVFLVGAFGAYAAVVTVYLAIAAFSLRWDAAEAKTPGSAASS